MVKITRQPRDEHAKHNISMWPKLLVLVQYQVNITFSTVTKWMVLEKGFKSSKVKIDTIDLY